MFTFLLHGFSVSFVLCKFSPVNEVHPLEPFWKKVKFLKPCMSTENALLVHSYLTEKKCRAKLFFVQSCKGIVLLSPVCQYCSWEICCLSNLDHVYQSLFSWKILESLSLIFWNCILILFDWGQYSLICAPVDSLNLTDPVLYFWRIFFLHYSIPLQSSFFFFNYNSSSLHVKLLGIIQ